MYMNIQLYQTEAIYCFESATKLFKEMKEKERLQRFGND